jgi:hypothetical protein
MKIAKVLQTQNPTTFLAMLALTIYSGTQTYAAPSTTITPASEITPQSYPLDRDSFYSMSEDFDSPEHLERTTEPLEPKTERPTLPSLKELDEQKVLADQEFKIEMEKARAQQKSSQWAAAVKRMHNLGVVIPKQSILGSTRVGLTAGLVATGIIAAASGIPSGITVGTVLIPLGAIAGLSSGILLAVRSIVSAPVVGLGSYAWNRLRSSLTRSPISIQTLRDHSQNTDWVDKLNKSFTLSEIIKSKLPDDTQAKIQEKMDQIYKRTFQARAQINQRRKSLDAKVKAFEELSSDEREQKFKPISHKIADSFCRFSDRLRPNKGVKEKLSQFFRESIFKSQTDPTADRAITYKANLDKESAKLAQDEQILDARIIKARIQVVDQVRQQEDKEQRLAARAEARVQYQKELAGLRRQKEKALKQAAADKKRALSALKASLQEPTVRQSETSQSTLATVSSQLSNTLSRLSNLSWTLKQ